MDELQRQYLVAAVELAKASGTGIFNEDDVTAYIDLDPAEPNYAERFGAITTDLMYRGFIQSRAKAPGVSRRTFRLTRMGIEEAERLQDPVVQRKEQRKLLLRAIYLLADDQPGGFVSWEQVASHLGMDPADAEQKMKADALAEQLERSRLITIEVAEGGLYRITPDGIDEVEGNERRSTGTSSVVYNIGVAQGSIIGNQQHANVDSSFDFSVYSEIKRRGGDDAEVLERMIDELHDLLKQGEELPKGSLAPYGEIMARNEWIIKPVVDAVMRFATSR